MPLGSDPKREGQCLSPACFPLPSHPGWGAPPLARLFSWLLYFLAVIFNAILFLACWGSSDRSEGSCENKSLNTLVRPERMEKVFGIPGMGRGCGKVTPAI